MTFRTGWISLLLPGATWESSRPTFSGSANTTTCKRHGNRAHRPDRLTSSKLAKDFVTWAKLPRRARRRSGPTSDSTRIGRRLRRSSPSKADPCFSNQITFDVIRASSWRRPGIHGPAYPQAQDYMANSAHHDVLVNKTDPKKATRHGATDDRIAAVRRSPR